MRIHLPESSYRTLCGQPQGKHTILVARTPDEEALWTGRLCQNCLRSRAARWPGAAIRAGGGTG